MYTLFYSPQGKAIKNIDLSQMKTYIIDEFENYWFNSTSDAFNAIMNMLMVIVDGIENVSGQ